MDVSPVAALVTLLMGMLSGSLGAMVGIGGGVFLVPFLVLVVGLPFHQAAAVVSMRATRPDDTKIVACGVTCPVPCTTRTCLTARS